VNTAIIYRRVSTAKQALGYSLDVQARVCQRFAKWNKLTIVADYCDAGKSAWWPDRLTQRKQLLDGFGHLPANQQPVVLVSHYDRWCRLPTSDDALLQVVECALEIHRTVETQAMPHVTQAFLERRNYNWLADRLNDRGVPHWFDDATSWSHGDARSIYRDHYNYDDGKLRNMMRGSMQQVTQ